MNTEALSGLKVLEYSNFISGPYCAKLLADLGAEVIKVEKPGLGDKARGWGPFPQDIPHPEKSGLFLYLNTNKRGVTLDLRNTRGAKIFNELVKWADVLVENNPPTETERLGIDYETLHRVNPALVVTSITYFGQTGPYRDYKGCDLIGLHSSGVAFTNPPWEVYDLEQNQPLKLPGHSGDFLGGLTSAICTISGVFTQQKDGVGLHIDLSQQEAMACLLCSEIGDYYDNGIRYSRDTSNKKEQSPKYACKDGFVMVSNLTVNDQFWEELVSMIGNPDWAENEIYQTPDGRHNNWKQIRPKIEAWMKMHTVAEIKHLASSKRFPFSIIHSAKEVADAELFAARDFFVDVYHKQAGKIRFSGAPCKFSSTPSNVKRPAPLLGEHNHEVYCQMLGYTSDDLVRMKQAGII